MDQLVVSLLNTGRQEPDPLQTPLGAARWWASVQPEAQRLPPAMAVKPRFDVRLVEPLRALRDALTAALAGQPAPPVFTGSTATDAVLFPIAYAAASLLAAGRTEHIKACAHGPCGLLFLDQTKNGSRRWCSLRCMERARAPRRRTIPG